VVGFGSGVRLSALARVERGGALEAKGMALASNRLTQLANSWHEIEPSAIVRESALRFLRVHPLRAAEALQLAAAFATAERRRPKSSHSMSASPMRRRRKASHWLISPQAERAV
jgi:hypothetical protein